ncbi:MAG: DUF2846 domain-containing protein [Reyranella sp.]|nr:MAG: DUF2846 domain-containing protein [Reyranella sp.]
MHPIFVAALLLVLAACQTSAPPVTLAAPAQDAAGKQFAPPPPGMAAVYFYNPDASPVVGVAVDGREIGRLDTRTWMRVEIVAGHHVLRCRRGDSVNARWVNLPAGSTRFVDVQMRPGDHTCTIKETDAGVGRAGVLAGNRAQQLP